MNDRFIVGYSGNLGRAHELGIVLDAAERLRYRLEIVFLIIGEGNQRDNLQAQRTCYKGNVHSGAGATFR